MTSKHENLGSELTRQVIAAGIAVHREFGPGLDEADYERALHLELLSMGIEHEYQVPLPLIYKGAKLECGYRMDVVVGGCLLLELKAVEKLHSLHEAQLITYLRLAQIKLGLLMNFGSLVLRDGIVRRASSLSKVCIPRVQTSDSHATDDLFYEIIDAALEVQHVLGPGLLRSAYVAALTHEIKMRSLKVELNLPANLLYRERLIPSFKELPMIVEGRFMVGCVCAKKIEPIHLARLRSLLKAAKVEEGICLNFQAESMAAEIRRFSIQTKPLNTARD